MSHCRSSQQPARLAVQGGFVRSAENRVAIIRSLGFDLRLTVEHPPLAAAVEPLTILVENVRGQAVEISAASGRVTPVLRADAALLFECAGSGTQLIELRTPPPSEEFEFFFLGDLHGELRQFHRIISDANAHQPLFMLANGDLTHGGDLRDYHGFLDALNTARVPCFTSIGNHDRRALGSRTTYRTMLAPMYYAFDVADARFVVLDSSRKRGLPRVQYRWLEEELRRAGSKRVFVVLHRPPVCPKYNYLSFSASANARRFLRLMQAYGVECVFGSHIHAFAEFTRQHVRYVVSGGGGGALWHPANVHHYLRVTVRRQGVDVRVVPLPTPAATVGQRVKDAIAFNVRYHVRRRTRKISRVAGNRRPGQRPPVTGQTR